MRLDLRQRLGHDGRAVGGGLLEFLGQEVHVQEDRAQGIADFVGDPGRQAAQQGKVLDALRLAFQALALGDFVVQGGGALLEALFEGRQALRVQERVIPRLQERLAEGGQQAAIHAQGGPFDRQLQARHLPDRLGRQPQARGHVLQQQLLRVLVEHLAGEQRPHGVVVQHQRHGEMHQPRAIARQDQLASGQGVRTQVQGVARRQGEGTPVACRLLGGVQPTPRRPGVEARPQQASRRIDQGDRQVRGVGVGVQTLVPALRVEERGTQGRGHGDPDGRRRGLTRLGLWAL